MGFLGRPKEFNVATTRAMSLLVVVGNEDVLQQDSWIYQFLLFCRRHDRVASSGKIDYVDGTPPLSLLSDLRVYDDSPPREKSLQSALERHWIERSSS